MSNYFGTALTGGSTINNIEYTGPVYEGYSVNHGGAYAMEMETALEQVAITQLVAEMATIDHQAEGRLAQVTESYDVEAILEQAVPVLEAAGSGVVAKVKAFLMKLWGKVKAFFASVVRSVDAMTKSTADFVKKYKKQIEGLKLAGFKYEMYTYTLDGIDLAGNYTSATMTADGARKQITKVVANVESSDATHIEAAEKAIDTYREGKEERLEQFRDKLLGGSGSAKKDADDFREEVRKSFRSGKDETEEVTVNIQTIIKQVQDTKKLENTISKAQKAADKFYKDAIKAIDDLEKGINKGTSTVLEPNKSGKSSTVRTPSEGMVPKAAAVASIISSEISAQQSVVNSYISEWTAAVKERDAVYKKVILKAFSYKRED